MVGWHHRHNGHGFGWTPESGDGQGGLACYSPWGHKESDTNEWLNWPELSSLQCKFCEGRNFFSILLEVTLQSLTKSCFNAWKDMWIILMYMKRYMNYSLPLPEKLKHLYWKEFVCIKMLIEIGFYNPLFLYRLSPFSTALMCTYLNYHRLVKYQSPTTGFRFQLPGYINCR